MDVLETSGVGSKERPETCSLILRAVMKALWVFLGGRSES